ncbi:MAG: radical SAM protein [Desulfobacteraceae bacterium]|nr:radical SAM protein [Desulfobacteraceae bacterium]
MRSTHTFLFIHPPISKPCEPPAGLAKLGHALSANGINYHLYDANLAGLLRLLGQPVSATDTWTRRAVKHVAPNLNLIRQQSTYTNRDKYKRTVMDVNRVLERLGRQYNAVVSLSNYGADNYSPVRSDDLLRAAENYSENPFLPVFRDDIRSYFRTDEPDIIGISVNYFSQAVCAFAIAGWIKTEFPEKSIVMGGGLVTSWMKIPGFKNPFVGVVDELVAGPGEPFLLSLAGVECLPAATDIGYDYKRFDLDQYLSPVPVLPFSTATGCWWRKCAFCPEKFERQTYAPKNKTAVIESIHSLRDRHHPGLLHFLDNALSPGLLRRLIRTPPGVPWYGFVRITDHLADPVFAADLRKSGCVMLKLGVESGDQAVLDALHKGIDLDLVARALKTLKSAGISTYVYLLFGTPPESETGARKTLAFTRAHAANIDFLNPAIFNLPAFSREAENLDTIAFYDGDLSLYTDYIHPKGWSRSRARQFLDKTFKKDARVRAILANDPPYFTSNHAPFFNTGLFS